MGKKGLGFICFLAILPLCLGAQVPFSCTNDFYLTLGADATPLTIYNLQINGGGTASFSPLSNSTPNQDINAIGYRSTDNLIYGINPSGGPLYRIDANGDTEILGNPSGDPLTGLFYFAGDVTPDGRYLTVVGTIDGSSRAIYHIDLEDPSYPATRTDLNGPEVSVADVSFDPFTGQLFGFDSKEARLVMFNHETGTVWADYPSSDVAYMMGALFFDAFGQLWGYGRSYTDEDQRSLFRIDKTSGDVDFITQGPPAQRNDGCSCPYTIKLREWVNSIDLVPCTNFPVLIEIANASGQTQTNLSLDHNFPVDFRISSIETELTANLVGGGPGTNFFNYEDLELPLGLSQIEVWLEILPEANGTYQFQSELSGFPIALGGSTLSDNPLTVQIDDPVQVEVGPIMVDFSNINTNICPGTTVELNPSIYGVDYLWSDGSTSETFTISEGGTYFVTISSGCDLVEESITINELELEVDLGPDRSIFLGDSLQLNFTSWPSNEPIIYQNWQVLNGEIDICIDCPSQNLRPLFDVQLQIEIESSLGCKTTDNVWIEVLKDYEVYLPNAFSPNTDGINDYFFPQSRFPQSISTFRIFDRWGNLVFDQFTSNPNTNDPLIGWDGKHLGKAMPVGTYVYLLEVNFLDGITRRWSGDVSLLR